MDKGNSMSQRNLQTIQSQNNRNKTDRKSSYRKKTLSNAKVSQSRNSKSHSQSLIRPGHQTQNERNRNSILNNSALRSKVFSVHLLKPLEQNVKISSPYQKFAKQLNIKLPTPKEKFLQFVQIPPFNRLNNHLQFISHILQKNIEFFRKHPISLVNNLARKIIKLDLNNIPNNYMVILVDGVCYYDYKNNEDEVGKSKPIPRGSLIVRKNFDPNRFSYDSSSSLSLIGFHYHDYSSFISQYLNENMDKFKSFLTNIQIFKIFHEQALQKIFASLTLHFFVKGQDLYCPGDEANSLFVIVSGSVARKIIVQLDKTNKIPLQGFSKLVKVMSRSYEHRIQFQKQDLVGVSEIVQNIPTRSQKISISEDATILAIDRNAIEQNLDEYIQDRLRKYNTRKYPKNYDQLCENYLKEKLQNRKTEERKIAALKDEFHKSNNEKKTQKITNIIKLYQERIKHQQKQHLIEHKKIQRVVQNDN